MTNTALGRLASVDPRDYWKDEARDFTPWLARPENIALLSETLGMELEVQATEECVGPFRADILCQEMVNGRSVLVENQLGKTDHTHLGQILTYAAGLDAVVVVWIARRFTEEHRATLDWLNTVTDDGLHFFGLEIELWRIGESVPAPKFNIVCQPNDWKDRIIHPPVMTETKQFQLEYWQAYSDFLKEQKGFTKVSKPYPQNWVTHSLGRSGFWLASIASTYDSEKGSYEGQEIRIELDIDPGPGNQAKQYFAIIKDQKDAIEQAIGVPLVWHNPENARLCRIYTRKSANIKERADWPNQFQWLWENLQRFHTVFSPIVKELKLPE